MILTLVPYVPGALAGVIAYAAGAWFLDGFLGGSAATLAAVGAYQGATYLSETAAAGALQWALDKVTKKETPNA